MAKLKLNSSQSLRIRQAMDNVAGVLREIKAKPLSGQKLQSMQELEGAAQHLECFNIGVEHGK